MLQPLHWYCGQCNTLSYRKQGSEPAKLDLVKKSKSIEGDNKLTLSVLSIFVHSASCQFFLSKLVQLKFFCQKRQVLIFKCIEGDNKHALTVVAYSFLFYHCSYFKLPPNIDRFCQKRQVLIFHYTSMLLRSFK